MGIARYDRSHSENDPSYPLDAQVRANGSGFGSIPSPGNIEPVIRCLGTSFSAGSGIFPPRGHGSKY